MTTYNLIQTYWLIISILFCVIIAIIRKNNDYTAIVFKMTNVLFLPIILLLVCTFAVAKIAIKRTTPKEFFFNYLLPFFKKLFI